MTAYIAGSSCLILMSLMLALLPHKLIVVDLAHPHPLRMELMLAMFLSLICSFLLFCLFHQSVTSDRTRDVIECLVVTTFIALIYFDVRFFIIPDAYVIVLLVAAFVGPLAAPWRSALFGAGLCTSLVGGVALVWRWRTGADGMGFGDVKLATALGALLGMEKGLWAVSAAACGGAIVGLLGQARQVRRPVDESFIKTEPYVVPFGAALAASGAVILLFFSR